ncbi:signal peptidase I (plasmid) [Aneurinibacillus sp. Ricciae_BoGa-3]|uniref:signal peptidase I n=1 Tax=Aneurinibacillus sp. Ricciae_BoGa-3 TaxID=3022697 RepID=UPI002340A78A|nr:signal peptidase I [Aneurinibacillus sp. Ricciae_BoGa-3]WCK57732.1 signal peptidase I [Aneurinibacillus sp. Ricciae_BoGa-3]
MEWKFRELFDARFRELFVKKFGKNIFRLGRIIIVLVLLSLFFQFSIVPSESMVPTIQVKDYLLIYTKSDYKRGDIISFKLPINEKESYLKRIIGLPGDTVEVKKGSVYVNDVALKENYLNEKPTYTYPKTKVPAGCYFVLGDNRNNSYDSHSWGFVKRDEIHGKVVAVLLPFQRFHLVHNELDRNE